VSSVSRKVLVVGSNSFSGASFSAWLLRHGHEVLGVSRSAEPSPAFLPYRWTDDQRRFRFWQIDLNHDLGKLEALMRKERPAIVVNFAAQSMVGESWKNPDHWMMTNVVSTVRLHEMLRHLEFLERYVHVTTPEVYGNTEGFIDENAPLNPSTPYAVSRAAGDMSLKTYLQAYGFPVVFTRAANVYGPGQQLYRIIPRTIFFLLTERKLQLHGGGYSRRSFIHIDDVSDATWRIAERAQPGDTFHISTSDIVTVRQLVERICTKLGARFEDSVEIVGERLGKDAAYMLDSSRLRRTLGWSDRISLDQGLEQCVGWVKRNLNELSTQPLDYVHKP
jgi:dTDP-glucose 4,6-dehydratase